MKNPKKVEKKNKIKIKGLSQRTRRVFAESDVLVMLEDMNDNIKLVADGLMGTNERLDRFEKSVDERFDVMDQKFDVMDQRFNAMDERFDTVDQRFDVVGQKFEGVDKKFEGFNQRFDRLESEFHEFKISTENNFKTVFGYLSRFDDELAEIKEEIKILRGELESKADMNRLEKLEKRVAVLEHRRLAMAEMERN